MFSSAFFVFVCLFVGLRKNNSTDFGGNPDHFYIYTLRPGSRNPGIPARLPIPISRDFSVPMPGFSALKFAILLLLINRI